jgi:hypothetical protein
MNADDEYTRELAEEALIEWREVPARVSTKTVLDALTNYIRVVIREEVRAMAVPIRIGFQAGDGDLTIKKEDK